MILRYTILVTGKVQGVFFRASTRQKAEELNITGFAQNLPNGNVLIEAEGEEEQLKKLAAWCKEGPPRASVDAVNVAVGEVTGFLSFSIK